MKIEGSYEGFQDKIQGILSFLSPFAEIENWYSLFSTFLVLLGIGFIIGQFLKRIPVLKSSGPQLSRGCIYFLFTLIFYVCYEAFYFFGGVSTACFLSFRQNFLNLQNSLNFSSNSSSRGSFERRITSAFWNCPWIYDLMIIWWRNHGLNMECRIAFPWL